MNLILTTSCNNDCSFCFAKDVLEKHEFDIDDIKHVLNLVDNDKQPIKLLGGEPTLYSKLDELLNYLGDIFSENPIMLISNFLFNKKTRDMLNSHCETIKDFHTLVNVSEMTNKKFNIVSDNILNTNIPYKKLGYTINLDYPFHYYEGWLNKFKEKIEFFSIRVSLPFPNPSVKNEFYFYKKYEYIDYIIKFIKWAVANDTVATLDCGIYPCMVKDEKTEHFLSQYLNNFTFGCNFDCAMDIIDKSTVQYCYPGKNVKISIDKHKNINSIHKNLFLKKKIIMADKNVLPDECKNCEYLSNKCEGPCLGFIKYNGGN